MSLALSLASWGCDGSNPVAPVGAGEPAPATTYTVSLSAAPASAFAGAGEPVTITVSVLDNTTNDAPQQAVEASISTSLGAFSDGGALITLSVSGGQATATLMPGDEVGTAEILARVSDSAASLMLDVKDPGAPPEAGFSYNATELSVVFVDTSSGGPTSWTWDFGDGSATSTLQDPSHVYESVGDYPVRLTVGNLGGEASSAQLVSVFTFPEAGFDWCGLEYQVAFTSTSTGGATTFTWTFGDDEMESGNNPDPRHTYPSNPMNYLVTQQVENPEGTSSVSRTIALPARAPNICDDGVSF